jgi:uroporphyrinogen decarboxylase
MNKRERVLAAVHCEQPDRTPIALWRHWPKVDQTAEGLAKAVLDWQAAYDFDLIKVTPTAGYAVEDWGTRLMDAGNREGTRDYVDRPIKHVRDWEKIWPLNVHSGVLGRELQALRLIRAKSGPDIFILQTIFSPLTVARELCGDDVWQTHLREHPREFRRGLALIADTYARFAEESLRSGADGIFFATQCASHDMLTEDEYTDFGVAYDRHVLGAVADKADLMILHIHGFNIMFDLLAYPYPVHIINWHDRRTSPTLAQARTKTRAALMGGLNEWQTLVEGTPHRVSAEVHDAIRQTGGRGFLAGAGCVVSTDTPLDNIKAARAAVE